MTIPRADEPARITALRRIDGRLPTTARAPLPAQPSPLIGRERDAGQACGLLRRADVRLLTLTGPAGIGKTRLSVEVAGRLRVGFAHGALFVDLAPVRDPALVIATIARVLGVREAAGRSLAEQLIEDLRDKQVLLVLDNFEQVVAAAPAVAELLAGCAGVKVLATSREALHLRWEHRFPVPSLDLPDLAHLPPVDELAASPAVALFVDRAQAAAPAFRLTAHNARAVAQICVRLDGLPLAIELAAVRSSMLPPQDLLDRLTPRLALLSHGARDLPGRQQTLAAAIAWSYDLLDADEQHLLQQLSVFAGGWTLDAAEAVCGERKEEGGRIKEERGEVGLSSFLPSPSSVLDVLSRLVDKSLVVAETADGAARYRLLETSREFAAKQLAATGQTAAVRDRHLCWYLALAERAEPELIGPEQAHWLGQLEQEHGNLDAALVWATEAQHGATAGLRLATALWRFWEMRGHLSEGRRWLDRVLARGGGAPGSLRARALIGAGTLAVRQGDLAAARACFEATLAMRRELGDERGIAGALNNLGGVAHQQGDHAAARAFYEESLTLRRAVGDGAGVAASLNNLGLLASDEGDAVRAVAYHDESLVLKRTLGDPRGIAASLNNLGMAARAAGDGARAAELYRESLALYRELGDRWGIAIALHNLAGLARGLGDHREAAALDRESLAIRRELGDRPGIALCLEGLAAVAGAEREPERAARLFGAAAALRDALHSPLPPAERDEYERNLAVARGQSDEPGFAAAWTVGRAMPLDQAIDEALATTAPSPVPGDAPHGTPARPAPARLTRREREVTTLIAAGLTNREIAERLFLSQRTVETHVENILGKLGFSSRAQVAAWAVEHGLGPPPTP